MTDHYDVDHRRQRRGRRHARAHAGPAGQADPAAGARRLPARARWRTGSRGGVRRRPLHLRRTPGTTPTATPFQPQVHYFVGGATKLYGAALYRLRPEDFGELKHVDGVSPAWPLTYDDFEPCYTKAEWLYQVHGVHGEDPTEGHWSRQYPWPAVSHEPRIQQLVRRPDRPAGYHPFHAPCGILLDEADRAEEHVHPLHLVRRLPLPGARQVRRRDDRGAPAPGPPQRDPAGQRRGAAAGDRRRPAARSPAWWFSGGGAEETYEADVVVVCRRARPTAPRSCSPPPTTSTRRAGQRLRPGRPQLHVPQQQGHGRARRRSATTRCSRRPSALNDFYFGRRRPRVAAWATSRWSASRTPRR